MITSETEVTGTIDWFSYTADSPLYHPKSTMMCEELGRGLYGYTNGVRFLDGRIELVNPNRPEMRIHVQYSGGALLDGHQKYQVSPFEIIALQPQGMRVARIDAALDVKHGSLDIKSLADMVDRKRYLSPSSKAMFISTLAAPGETLYIGAPSSKTRLRIYDKAAEQGLDTEWTRLEIQVRGRKAGGLRDMLLISKDSASKIAPVIRAFADFPESRDYQQVVGRKSIGLSEPHRSETDTRAWLLTTVLSSLAREVARDETGTFLQDFVTRLNLAVVEAKKKISRT